MLSQLWLYKQNQIRPIQLKVSHITHAVEMNMKISVDRAFYHDNGSLRMTETHIVAVRTPVINHLSERDERKSNVSVASSTVPSRGLTPLLQALPTSILFGASVRLLSLIPALQVASTH